MYLWSIFTSNPNNPKEEGRDLPKHRDVPVKGTVVDGCRQQKFYPTLTFVAPRKVNQNRDRMPLCLDFDPVELSYTCHPKTFSQQPISLKEVAIADL
jgi:hypothetical protein